MTCLQDWVDESPGLEARRSMVQIILDRVYAAPNIARDGYSILCNVFYNTYFEIF